MHVDLHTLKAPDAAGAWRRLLSDLRGGLAGGLCGIMIHHQRMNDAALDFLDRLIAVLVRRRVPVLRFDQMEGIEA